MHDRLVVTVGYRVEYAPDEIRRVPFREMTLVALGLLDDAIEEFPPHKSVIRWRYF